MVATDKIEYTNIGDMIDLAIGTPEVGVVDFNMLAAVLHCLAQQLRARNKDVELRGTLPSGREPSHTVAVVEYAYDTVPPTTSEEIPNIVKKGPAIPDEAPPTVDQNTILVVERVPKEKYNEGVGSQGGPPGQRRISRSEPVGGGGRDGGPGARDGGTGARGGGPGGGGPGVGGGGPGVGSGGPGVAGGGPGVGGGGPGGPGVGGGGPGVGPGVGGGGPGGGGPGYGPGVGGGGSGGGGPGVGPGVGGGGPGGGGPGVRDDGTGVGGGGPGVGGGGPGYGSGGPGVGGGGPGVGGGGTGVDGGGGGGWGPAGQDGRGQDGFPGQSGGPGAPGQDGGQGQLGGPGQADNQGYPGSQGQGAGPIQGRGQGQPGQQTAYQPSSQGEIQRTESGTRLGPRLSLVTLSKFNALESVVEDIKNRVYGSLPKNEDLLKEVRSQSNLKAITDMWTSLNVSSRLEAAETGLAKLSSLLQDVINDPTKTQDLQALAVDFTSGGNNAGYCPDAEDQFKLKEALGEMQRQINELNNQFYDAMDTLRADRGTSERGRDGKAADAVGTPGSGGGGARGPSSDGARGRGTDGARDGEKGRDQGADRGRPDTESGGIMDGLLEDTEGAQPDQRSDAKKLSVTYEAGGYRIDVSELVDRIMSLENRVGVCCENMSKSDGLASDQFSSIQDQLDDLRKKLNGLQTGSLSPDVVKNLDGLIKLYDTVKSMQDQLRDVHATARALTAEREEKRHTTNALLEQIELLKTIKLDREDMEEAMADKVNLQMLTRKVSREQFEMACNDLSKTLEQTLNKLTNQEELWQQALDDIQREIESKLDKVELSPVKEFFNTKLKKLQDNLKQMASLRNDILAAGTKKKLLRDVKCLSCDQEAVMQTEATPAQSNQPPRQPPPLSMKPYLTYELDTIRKQQASLLPQRNMRDWENIGKQMTQPKLSRARSATDKHLCNRYCGGSHTVTTPAQRVARIGHFMKQWGPEVIPMSGTMAAGDDAKQHKDASNEREKGGAGELQGGPSRDRAQVDSKTKKPIILRDEECRCLEEEKE